MEAHLGKIEFFCKLGYGKQDICKVLENLGQGALEDDVLKELIRVGSRPVAQERQAQHPLPKLVPRGSCSSPAVPKQPEEVASDSSSHLRPIVIDGSNIAMSAGESVFHDYPRLKQDSCSSQHRKEIPIASLL
uniref:Rege-1 UBA-like domain-containing protein n=1 Tax=Chrysemys picta bellii TaxID=8478 RepID=A0A8C3HTJ1_CHRPI